MNIYNLSVYNFPRLYKKIISDNPLSNLGIIVVIPCYNEHNLISSLESLYNCDKTNCDVEVIIIINASEKSDNNVKEQNKLTYNSASQWKNNHSKQGLNFYLINIPDFPEKHAGVGLARKTGMDEAWFRFKQSGNENGIIVSFDADCLCDKNYLKEIEKHFNSEPKPFACSIYFEHLLEGNLSEEIYENITKYELFLRYYINGLRYAGFPFAYHTLGSCFAVRASVYEKQGGMNKRKAGEDFHFLHKIIPLGNFTELNSTRVIPSPRLSDRVPFGTGKAMIELSKNSNAAYYTYNPKCFIALNILNIQISDNQLYNNSKLNLFFNNLPTSIREYFNKIDYQKNIEIIRKNTSSKEAFVKRFYRWFDALKTLQYFHFAKDNFYGLMPVEDAVIQLLEEMAQHKKSWNDYKGNIRKLLNELRLIDKKSKYFGFGADYKPRDVFFTH